jgi:hypothetical protein
VTGAIAVLLPCATAVLVAASARSKSLVTTLLVAYLALVTATVGAVLALSPFRLVTANGLTATEAALLAGALFLWWVRGRPGVPLAGARAAVRIVASRPETLLFAVGVGGLLAYELLLGVAAPPANWDSLTYHLARAAAWAQHGGVYWIPNAPTDRINEFQPLAEQEILYGFAATGGSSLLALPQFLAELAILVAVYGSARRLRFDVRSSACATFLLATFSLIGLEASTAQNDLVAASFPVTAACLLLGTTSLEAVLAGVAVACGLGAKLTTALVLPVLLVLAILRGRRALLLGIAGGLAGFAAIGMWGFVLNEVHTGHLLGHGGGRVEHTTSPSWPQSAVTALYVLYAAMDLSIVSDRATHWLLAVGLIAGIVAAAWALRRTPRRAAGDGAAVALPFVAAVLAVGVAGVLAYLGRAWGYPIRGPGGIVGPLTRGANEDFSAFGPIGAILLLCIPFLALIQYGRRRADARALALGAAVPVFLALLVLEAAWDEFLTRFLVVPVVLSAPLLAWFFRSRAATAAFAAASVTIAVLTLANIASRPFDERPWRFSQAQALTAASESQVAEALDAFDRVVPGHACVGAILGTDEPSFPLYGSRLQHRVRYLAVADAVAGAHDADVGFVVITTGTNRWAASSFRAAGWRVRPLGSYWLLAVEPHAGPGDCRR